MSRPKEWKDYEDFAAGIATNRLKTTDSLAGKTIVCNLPNRRLELTFKTADKVDWKDAEARGTDWYEAIEVAPKVYFVDTTFESQPRESLTLVFNVETLRLLAVRSVVREEPVHGEPQVAQELLVGTIGDGSRPATGFVPAPTRDLIGLRGFYTYSPYHVYEHIYLSSERYAWQCLVGVQRGHGDVDLSTTYKFDENQYVFTFREFLIPVASVFFYNFEQLRSTGKFLGITAEGRIENKPAGAFIQKASMTFYPKEIEPV